MTGSSSFENAESANGLMTSGAIAREHDPTVAVKGGRSRSRRSRRSRKSSSRRSRSRSFFKFGSSRKYPFGFGGRRRTAKK